WRQLLQARAVENLAYVAGVNRIGTDGNGLDYSGDSLLVDFKGNLLIDREPETGFVETAQLDAEALHDFKTKFPVWQDADEFDLKL
ncbi:MAG: nitrilase-related carbon-nitrogen hydrolase, partial [Coleofasciculus sp. C2-GNP5-27]